jgi:YD repeat-containing protein
MTFLLNAELANASVLITAAKPRASSAVDIELGTRYTYDKLGQLNRVQQPDQSSIYYLYDDAHRMVGMSDVIRRVSTRGTPLLMEHHDVCLTPDFSGCHSNRAIRNYGSTSITASYR